MKKIAILFAVLVSALNLTYGQDFSVRTKEGNTLYFSITDTTGRTVAVVPLKNYALKSAMPEGKLTIPGTVVYKEKKYTVTSIAPRAFSGAESLEFVSIPSTVDSIGFFAFAGCTSLNSLVLPAGRPEIGDGAFSECNSLSNISFGSDWDEIDFNVFSECAALSAVYIPAKVRKISNLKNIVVLGAITVDPNNPYFSSIDGLLYSKAGDVLYACPSARKGRLEIPSGTKTILDGAFRDCNGLEEICLPETIRNFSYAEFCGCSYLATLEIRANIPPMTARYDGSAVFAILSSNPALKILVPANNIEIYRVLNYNLSGRYETMNGTDARDCTADELLGKKNIGKIKNNR